MYENLTDPNLGLILASVLACSRLSVSRDDQKAPGRAKRGIDNERDPGEERNGERLYISPIFLCQRPDCITSLPVTNQRPGCSKAG